MSNYRVVVLLPHGAELVTWHRVPFAFLARWLALRDSPRGSLVLSVARE